MRRPDLVNLVPLLNDVLNGIQARASALLGGHGDCSADHVADDGDPG